MYIIYQSIVSGGKLLLSRWPMSLLLLARLATGITVDINVNFTILLTTHRACAQQRGTMWLQYRGRGQTVFYFHVSSGIVHVKNKSEVLFINEKVIASRSRECIYLLPRSTFMDSQVDRFTHRTAGSQSPALLLLCLISGVQSVSCPLSAGHMYMRRIQYPRVVDNHKVNRHIIVTRNCIIYGLLYDAYYRLLYMLY